MILKFPSDIGLAAYNVMRVESDGRETFFGYLCCDNGMPEETLADDMQRRPEQYPSADSEYSWTYRVDRASHTPMPPGKEGSKIGVYIARW